MKTLKWLRPLALLLALALAAAACGGSSDDDGDDGSSDTTAPSDDGGEDGGEPAGDPEPGPGFDGTTIKLGVITPTSGTVAIIGNPLTAGNKAYFDYVNEELGGVAGKYPIELVIADSGYDPTKAGQEYAAMKDQVVLFAQLLGTPIVNAILEQLESDQIVASPASLDSFWVREPNLLPLGGPYQIQAINALNWYVEENGEDKVLCSLIQDDPYGEAGQEGLDFAAEELGLEIAVTATFPAPPAPQTPETFTAPIGQLAGANCDMVFFVATPSSTGPALGVAAGADFAPQWIGQSPSWIGALIGSPLLDYLEANFLVASEGVNWGDTSVEGMAELMRIKEEYAPADQAADIYFNFGYIQAKVVHQLLEKAVEQGDLSREGILSALENLGTVSFDDLSGDYVYGPAEERVPPTKSSIFKVDAESETGLSLVEGAQGIEAPFAKDFEFAG